MSSLTKNNEKKSQGLTTGRIVLFIFLIIFFAVAGWWYHVQGEAMWLLSQAKWPWVESETNFKIDSDFSLNISDLNIKNEQYSNLWSLSDFSVDGTNKYYNVDNNFSARGEFNIAILGLVVSIVTVLGVGKAVDVKVVLFLP